MIETSSDVHRHLQTQVSDMATNGSSNGVLKPDGSKILPPTELCHVVLKTTTENWPKMVDFYLKFLGAKIVHQNHRIAFMTYDNKDRSVLTFTLLH
jgi:hypothetical protein